jgi:hypothetical protein
MGFVETGALLRGLDISAKGMAPLPCSSAFGFSLSVSPLQRTPDHPGDCITHFSFTRIGRHLHPNIQRTEVALYTSRNPLRQTPSNAVRYAMRHFNVAPRNPQF